MSHFAQSLRAAYAKGKRAADDPASHRADCPYQRFEHRKSWMDGFDAGRKDLAE